ncbi:MAG TPA: HAMP domain-containing sensor histidine kinase [Ktedonobacteraceae bacterium]|nr:HAMP domain-containing sensor histidine kinase [Ktedonobacteraceae bacterium]
MNRVLLLLENKKNRDLLAEWIETRYEAVPFDGEPDLNAPFDLCLIDGPTLDRTWRQVQIRKRLEQPIFLPFVLITTRKDADMVTRHLWQTVDELILAPIEKVELQARAEVLLRARRLSLDLKLRNEDLESFFHAMTHDLRAPLRVVAGFTEALAEDEAASLSQQGQHYLATIQTATGQMQELIDALIGFSRLGRDELPLQEVDLGLVCEKCLQALQQEICEKDAHILLSGEFPHVQANPHLLKMALTNLLSNACKFTAPGVQPQVVLRTQVQGGMCRIEVQDTGIGIEPEDQARLFTPFVQLHGVEEYPGMGLGLATARKAVTLMGGRMGLRSSPGQGSTFWIDLKTAVEVHHALSRY